MIFISGVHGVGKSYFCNIVKEQLGINTYSASTLIAARKQKPFSPDKLVADIDINQQYLLAAIDDLRRSGDNFILDGHFCLLNAEGTVTRIGAETFTSLHPEAIILLTEDPKVIAARRKERDGISYDVDEIRLFQDEETAYAKEIASNLEAKLMISTGADDLNATLNFIRNL